MSENTDPRSGGASAGIVLVLGAILAASFWMRVEPKPPAPPEPAPAPTPAAPAPSRALAPLERVEPARPEPVRESGWTAQLGVFCSRDSVDALVASAGGSSKLRLLDVEVSGKRCTRVCWGTYDDRDAAAAASDRPPALRKSSVVPKRLEEVRP